MNVMTQDNKKQASEDPKIKSPLKETWIATVIAFLIVFILGVLAAFASAKLRR